MVSAIITRLHLIFRVSHLKRSDLQIGRHAHIYVKKKMFFIIVEPGRAGLQNWSGGPGRALISRGWAGRAGTILGLVWAGRAIKKWPNFKAWTVNRWGPFRDVRCRFTENRRHRYGPSVHTDGFGASVFSVPVSTDTDVTDTLVTPTTVCTEALTHPVH
jgi:hypothetical protein